MRLPRPNPQRATATGCPRAQLFAIAQEREISLREFSFSSRSLRIGHLNDDKQLAVFLLCGACFQPLFREKINIC